MNSSRIAALLTGVVLLVLLAFPGCQKGSGSGPVAPNLGPDSSLPGLADGSNVFSNRSEAVEFRTSTRTVWGLWHIKIDSGTLEPEIIPLRGCEWHANVVEFLQPPHPLTNLGIFIAEEDSDVPNGLLAVDVTLHHPFPTLPRFRGFDVRGAFLANGSYTSLHDNTARLADPDPKANEARLLNPDGYVRWFNPVEFKLGGLSIFQYIDTVLGTSNNTTATLNPYKYFSDDFLDPATKDLPLQAVEIDVADRGTFSVTSSITRRYMIQFPTVGGVPVFEFSYIVDASYFDPDETDPNFPVESYAGSANMQEVYKVVCTDTDSTAYYVDETTLGGHLRFTLELFDWQANGGLSTVSDEIGKVIVESPTLLDGYGGMIDITDDFKTTAIPASVTSSVATMEILDVSPTSSANQMLLFTVTSAYPSDYSNPWDQPYPGGPVLAAYFMWDAPVADELTNTPPYLASVVGPDLVYENTHDATYTCELTDPDPGQTHTYMWSIVPAGMSAVFDIPPTGPDETLVIDWCDYDLGMYDMQCQAFDGFDYGESEILEITRALSMCNGSAHYYDLANYNDTWLPYSMLGFYDMPRMDVDFFMRGDFEGQGVIQAGKNVLMNFIADTSGLSSPATQSKWRIPGMSYDRNLILDYPASPRVVLSLDTSPDLDPSDGYDDNRIVIVTSHHHDKIYILDADESCPQADPPNDDPPPLDILDDVSGCKEIPCIAIDENDDIWALVFGADDEFELNHWSYIVDDNSGGPYYSYENGDILNLTTELGAELDVYDMVVAFANNHLYILEVGEAPFTGKLHRVNLNTSPPTYVESFGGATDQIFTNPMDTVTVYGYYDNGTDTDQHFFPYSADITIDHNGTDVCEPEHCRIEVMSRLANWNTEVVRFGVELDWMDSEISTNIIFFTCAGISSQSDEGERVLFLPPADIFGFNFLCYWIPPVTW